MAEALRCAGILQHTSYNAEQNGEQFSKNDFQTQSNKKGYSALDVCALREVMITKSVLSVLIPRYLHNRTGDFSWDRFYLNVAFKT